MTSLLPNPPCNENENEEVTLKNFGTQPANLGDWKLGDLSGKLWALDGLGTIDAGEKKTIGRAGQPMTLNNGGDTIDLIDPDGRIVQA